MKTARQLCIAILIVVCIAAFWGSFQLINDPTGHTLHLPFDDIKGTPFKDYSTPGWILFIAVGCISLITVIITFLHKKIYPLFIMAEGVVLFIWILVQIEMIRDLNFFQFLLGLAGIILFLLGNLIRKNNKQSVAHIYQPQNTNPYHQHKKSHHHKHRRKQ